MIEAKLKVNKVVKVALIVAVAYGANAIYNAMKDESAEKVEMTCLVYGNDSAECRNEKFIVDLQKPGAEPVSEVKDSMGILPLMKEKCATDGLDEAACNERIKKEMPMIAKGDAMLDNLQTRIQNNIKVLCSGRGGDIPACIDRQNTALREMGRIMIKSMRSDSEEEMERISNCEVVLEEKYKDLRDYVAILKCMEKVSPTKKPAK